MKNFQFIEEIKKKQNITLEEIVSTFMEHNVHRNVALQLIRINFNYEYPEIIYYLDIIYRDVSSNPFNDDFINNINSSESTSSD
ncbi:conserved protein of unknown function [Chryseobacterium sp. JV274]|nr:conserved protein of unknown function [Chryseobacterium sp. JV274]